MLFFGVFVLALFLAGCSGTVIVGPGVPVFGDIRICTYDRYVYGYVYLDGRDTGYYIDGAGWAGSYCTGYIRVELNRRYRVEVWDPRDGVTYNRFHTPTRDGQTITL